MLRPPAAGEVVIGLALVILGAWLALEAASIQVTPVYSKVGPRLFPGVVAAALILVGLSLAFVTWRRDQGDGQPPALTEWQPLAFIAAGVVADIILLERAGFAIASTVLFLAVAWGFGSRRPVRDGAIAILLSVIVFEGFTRGLGLNLPAGILAGLL
jgi:putative tricarboxylic transport membrane protein